MKTRYSRQELIIGQESQKKLSKSEVCIVGVGALGSFTAELLARAGIGNIKLIDRDIIELHNLQRQSLFSEADLSKPKAFAAKERLSKINSSMKIEAIAEDLSPENISIIDSDLILDCTDNLSTRFLINDYCVKNKIPWIHSAAIGTIGRVMNILPGYYCFRCHFKKAEGLDTCDTIGILNTTIAITSSIQASEAINILTDGKPNQGLICISGIEISKFDVKKNEGCKCCVLKKFEFLTSSKKEMVKFCGSGTYQIKGDFDFDNIKKKLSKLGKFIDFGNSFVFDKISVFDNRVLIKAENEKEARIIYSKYIGD